MSRSILITGARIIDPVAGTDRTDDLFIHDGVIADPPGTPPADVLVIDAAGLVATPGFIDLHAHLREPGFEDKESIETGTAAAAAGGFTTVCAMPNTSPAIDTAAVVDFIAHRAREAGPVRVLAFGAVSRGRKGVELTDMEELARAGVVGFTDDGSPVATGLLMEHALLYAGELGLPVMDHCEDHSITAGLGMHEGPVASRLGLAGYPSAGEESIIARDIALLGLTGGHFHVAHVSTAGGVEMVRMAKRQGLRVTAEVTPNHLTMTDGWVLGCGCSTRGIAGPLTLAAYDTRAKVSPPLRSRADRDALVEGLRDGTIDAVATDHAPHTFGDKGDAVRRGGSRHLDTGDGARVADGPRPFGRDRAADARRAAHDGACVGAGRALRGAGLADRRHARGRRAVRPGGELDGGREQVRFQGEEHTAGRTDTAGQSEDDDRGWTDSIRRGWSVTAAYLVLSDGTVYEGYAFGAECDAFGEVVFNTSMSGYQEMLTDPSYAGQILVPTYPMQGNYGINGADVESKDIKVAAFVVREHSSTPSHYDSARTLHAYLADEGVPGIWGVDTRAITRRIRSHGVMMGALTVRNPEAALRELASLPSYDTVNFVDRVTVGEAYEWSGEGGRRIAVVDCGVKYNILRLLAQRGCLVRVHPATATAEEILRDNPDGVVFSPGPGDPVHNAPTVATARTVIERVPTLGICLGHQIIARVRLARRRTS